MPDRQLTFVVYVRPPEHPEAVVVRVFEITRGNPPRPGTAWLFTFIDEAVDWLDAQGLHMLRPGQDSVIRLALAGDDDTIYGTWL